MKTNKHNLSAIGRYTLQNPESEKDFPLHLTEEDWLGYSIRLKQAHKMKTDSRELSFAERQRFEMNLNLIKRVSVACEIRNYALLEVYDTNQWREDHRTALEFAKSVDISRGHFFKCIKSARINIVMVETGLYPLRPIGRQTEKLGKLKPRYWVDAWRKAIAMAEQEDAPSGIIERYLDYYYDAVEKGIVITDLPFAGHPETDELPTRTILNDPSGDNDNGENFGGHPEWVAELTPDEESLFASILKIETWFASYEGPNSSRGRCMASLLADSASKHLEANGEIGKIQKTVKLASSKNPQLKRACYQLGLHLIAEHLNNLYLQSHQKPLIR